MMNAVYPLDYYIANLPDAYREITYRVYVQNQSVENVAKLFEAKEQMIEDVSMRGLFIALDRQRINALLTKHSMPHNYMPIDPSEVLHEDDIVLGGN